MLSQIIFYFPISILLATSHSILYSVHSSVKQPLNIRYVSVRIQIENKSHSKYLKQRKFNARSWLQKWVKSWKDKGDSEAIEKWQQPEATTTPSYGWAYIYRFLYFFPISTICLFRSLCSSFPVLRCVNRIFWVLHFNSRMGILAVSLHYCSFVLGITYAPLTYHDLIRGNIVQLHIK